MQKNPTFIVTLIINQCFIEILYLVTLQKFNFHYLEQYIRDTLLQTKLLIQVYIKLTGNLI